MISSGGKSWSYHGAMGNHLLYVDYTLYVYKNA